jgi:hypothetical protein
MTVLWGVKLYSLAEVYQFHLQYKMEAAGSSETLVISYQTRRCHIPEESNFYSHRRNGLISRKKGSEFLCGTSNVHVRMHMIKATDQIMVLQSAYSPGIRDLGIYECSM